MSYNDDEIQAVGSRPEVVITVNIDFDPSLHNEDAHDDRVQDGQMIC